MAIFREIILFAPHTDNGGVSSRIYRGFFAETAEFLD
jgi:hypothetical protein